MRDRIATARKIWDSRSPEEPVPAPDQSQDERELADLGERDPDHDRDPERKAEKRGPPSRRPAP